MSFHHIINGCSIDLRLLADRELDQAITNHEMRLALVNDELESMIGERTRRRPIKVPSLS